LINGPNACIYAAETVDYGLYEVEQGPAVQKDTIVDGVAHVLHDKKLKESTDRVPAKRGIDFGFRYVLKGLPANATQRVTIRVRHPPLTNPRTGKTFQESVWEDDAWIGRANGHAGWIMDAGWELVPGIWTIAVCGPDGRALIERPFTLVAPK
jgi:hypothetical protein